jgi:hypothetical protein
MAQLDNEWDGTGRDVRNSENEYRPLLNSNIN